MSRHDQRSRLGWTESDHVSLRRHLRISVHAGLFQGHTCHLIRRKDGTRWTTRARWTATAEWSAGTRWTAATQRSTRTRWTATAEWSAGTRWWTAPGSSGGGGQTGYHGTGAARCPRPTPTKLPSGGG